MYTCYTNIILLHTIKRGIQNNMEYWKVFYNEKTGEEYTAYTLRGSFPGEEESTAELIAAERGIDRKDIKTRIERR